MGWEARPEVTLLAFHPWNGSVIKLTDRRSGVACVAKVLFRSRIATNEARALRSISKICDLRIPSVFGQRDGVLIEEFIEGQTWHELIEAFPRRRFAPEYRRAVDALVDLHSKAAQTTFVGNPSPFRESKLRKLLNIRLDLLETRGLEEYEKIADIPGHWRDALEAVDVERIVDDLSVENGHHCLIHGDFKPDNLMITTRGDVAVLDWQEVTVGSPWYELAHLLPGTSGSLQNELLERYVRAARDRGMFKGLRASRASALFTSGLIFEELLRGWFNTVHRGANGKTFERELRLTFTNLDRLIRRPSA